MKKTCDLLQTFFHNGRTLSNTNEITNTFNLYFANIRVNLASEIETQLIILLYNTLSGLETSRR